MQYIRIEHLRTDHDYTQQYIADYLNVKREVYRRYEKGYRSVPVDILIQLASLYETSTDYLLGLTNEKKPYRRLPMTRV